MDTNLGMVAIVGIVAISLVVIFIFTVHRGSDIEVSADQGDDKFSLRTHRKANQKPTKRNRQAG